MIWQHWELSTVPAWFAFSSPATPIHPVFIDCPEWGAGEETCKCIPHSEEQHKTPLRLQCQPGLSCLKASGFTVNHWHEMRAKLLIAIKTVAVLVQKKHMLCCCFWELLAARQCRFGCIHRAWCSATKSWHWSPWSPGSSTAISAGQSTLASFLDAALMLQIVLCCTWRACFFRAILGSLHDVVRGLQQVYFAQTKSPYFANSYLWIFYGKKTQLCDNARDVRRQASILLWSFFYRFWLDVYTFVSDLTSVSQ